MQNSDHQIWKMLRDLPLSGQKILVGFSGGADSTMLLCVLHKLVPEQLLALHYHHGPGKEEGARYVAMDFCKNFCASRGIDFVSEKSLVELKSEAEYREQRYGFFKKHQDQSSGILVLGHHQDDLFETRLLRLIRGCGPTGLKAMERFDLRQKIFRPLLETTRLQILEYLKIEKVDFFTDPSNESSDYLRNWVRNTWLPQLELKCPGGGARMAGSLDAIVQSVCEMESGDLLSNQDFTYGIDRKFFLTLSRSGQKRCLALYLWRANHRDFSQAHLEEILKRLDNLQNELIFRIARLTWKVNAARIMVES